MAQTTTIQVQFGRSTTDAAAARSHLSAEIDDRDNGLNKGDTSFEPGDTAYFFVFKSDNVTISSMTATAGTIANAGAVNVEREEDVSFANSKEGSLGVPAISITSVTWLGADLGKLDLGDDKQTLTAKSEGVGIARVKYVCRADAYGLESPASLTVGTETITDFPILVLIVGEAT